MTHWANAYIGARYELGADGSTGTYDCWSLARTVLREQFNYDVPPIGVTTPTAATFIKTFAEHDERQRWQAVESVSEGDCVLLTQSRLPHHVGLWLDIDGGGILHAVEGAGVVYQSLLSLKMSGWRVTGFYRHV